MAKILLVEDEPNNSDMLSRRLRRKAYEVVTAMDGPTACELAQSERPDLILMDVQLLGSPIDGYEATQRLKSATETCGIPVIALTAHALPADREKALQAGCDDYDTKPVELPRLLEKMEALLKGRLTS
ncbi:MAG TPA: response regulator, partial [Gemmataceae bacterium]|jgi:CheY-like chemotaxis protein|nr:response regulator [Gemmataceae bacterium]HEV3443912.1 response regulator [Gemmataceae bacterium]